ncbi:MAG: hypothetical protein ACI9ZF_000630 [Bradyrhizobium sp.]|jgi:hypothetical protein
MAQIEYVVSPRHELVDVASAMLTGDMNLIKGVRRICKLRFSLEDPENEVFLSMRGIESETDIFTVGQARASYSLEYLQRMDAEIQSYLGEAKDDIFQACRRIIQAYS